MTQPPGTHLRYPQTGKRAADWRGLGPEIYRWISIALMGIGRFDVAGDFPAHEKAVILAAPHTSNWDGIWMIAAAGKYRIRLNWMGKAAIGKGPFGWLARLSGYIPVDRSGGKDLVRATVEAFEREPHLLLAIAPEGTRGSVEGWKSGFYHIARLAGVPIVIAVMDYSSRLVRISGEFWPTGDYEKDLQEILTHYEGARGRHKGRFTRADGSKV